jgi:iron complex transport system ATP-binding protein
MQRTDTLELADRRVGELSGGEQQRLLLARALAQAAPLLLMDEPTAHLDLQYQYNLLQQVRDLVKRENLAVMIVLHDLNLVSRYTDRVALLVKGELRALGNPKEVLTTELLSQAYHTPLQVLSLEKSGMPFILPPVG